MRFSRPCYDKPWRCPGWAGGGERYAKVDRCEDGRMLGWDGEHAHPQWRFHRCDTCDVVTWPYVTRWLDWRHWRWYIQGWLREWRFWRRRH